MNIIIGSNNYPIFLIHGFMGWGRDELTNHYYWGGTYDLQEILNDNGFEIHTLSVGPISSNWERAIEAYAQIKGGCVDYGFEHAKKYNVVQKPPNKCYSGIYPEWDENHPIHIIGHSQGGLTARMLEYLLALELSNETSNLLSLSYENYIASITTLSTPHNGTTLALIVDHHLPYLQNMSVYAGMMNLNIINHYYDFDLEQWNLEKNKSETYYEFIKRINNSEIKNTKNAASWDLSIEGSKEFNEIYQSNKNTYYFSYSTSSTKNYNNDKHIPIEKMSYYLRPGAYLIGSGINIDDSLWYENDGIVNTISMDGPHDEEIVLYNNKPKIGKWNHMGIFNYDHHQILLRRTNIDEQLINEYNDLIKQQYDELSELNNQIIIPELLQASNQIYDEINRLAQSYSFDYLLDEINQFEYTISNIENKVDEYMNIFEKNIPEEKIDELITQVNKMINEQAEFIKKINKQDENKIEYDEYHPQTIIDLYVKHCNLLYTL